MHKKVSQDKEAKFQVMTYALRASNLCQTARNTLTSCCVLGAEEVSDEGGAGDAGCSLAFSAMPLLDSLSRPCSMAGMHLVMQASGVHGPLLQTCRPVGLLAYRGEGMVLQSSICKSTQLLSPSGQAQTMIRLFWNATSASKHLTGRIFFET